jgi:hypothetical protein
VGKKEALVVQVLRCQQKVGYRALPITNHGLSVLSFPLSSDHNDNYPVGSDTGARGRVLSIIDRLQPSCFPSDARICGAGSILRVFMCCQDVALFMFRDCENATKTTS